MMADEHELDGDASEPELSVDGDEGKEAKDSDGEANDQVDEFGVRIRKAYTITRARKSWTEQEHADFLEALNKCVRSCKMLGRLNHH